MGYKKTVVICLLNGTVYNHNVGDVFMKKILHLIAQKPDYTGSGIYLKVIIK